MVKTDDINKTINIVIVSANLYDLFYYLGILFLPIAAVALIFMCFFSAWTAAA